MSVQILHGQAPGAIEWVREQLGINPEQCSGVVVRIGPYLAVTAEVTLLLSKEQLDALLLEEIRHEPLTGTDKPGDTDP